MTKVSVIIPIYNAENYLKKCIESVLHQTLQGVEIILVDDGSTDGSGAICDQYSVFQNIKVLHQENKGLSAARNTGLDAATGDYVAFLDSDDYVDPEMYNEMYLTAKKENVDIVYCNYAVVKNDKILPGGGYIPSCRKKNRAR